MVQFPAEQRHSGRDEQPDSGGQIPNLRLPHDKEPHCHDLPPRCEAEFRLTHMKQRGTAFFIETHSDFHQSDVWFFLEHCFYLLVFALRKDGLSVSTRFCRETFFFSIYTNPVVDGCHAVPRHFCDLGDRVFSALRCFPYNTPTWNTHICGVPSHQTAKSRIFQLGGVYSN